MTEDPKVTDGEVHWTIQELLTSKELQAEGRAMNHCVSSYANNCLKGSASIWSMQVSDGKTSPHRVMTVAVNNKSRVISQARGKYNALPSGKTPNGRRRAFEKAYAYYLRQSKRILSLWREQEGLRLSSRI